MQVPPLSLYVHLPWCVRKCPYCDFNSHTAGPAMQRLRYMDALQLDLEREAARAGGRPLISVFLGGGTPSLFSPEEIARVLRDVDRYFTLADDVEITMEANPGTVECGDPLGYRQAGVNRLSIGAQSFRPESLEALGRIHTVDDIERSVRAAQRAGFININLDVMYALPGQQTQDAVYDLQRAIALQPAHVSWYQLTLEPNTVFHARPPANLPDDEQSYEMQLEGQALLASRGFEQYEISAYARHGRRCRHNINYWSFGDYLGVGAGAHGKLSNRNKIRRCTKPANPLEYLRAMENGLGPAARSIDGADRIFEFMLNALRLTEGFETRLFEDRTGLAATEVAKPLSKLRRKRLIDEVRQDYWRVTGLGRRFLNDLQAEFLPQ